MAGAPSLPPANAGPDAQPGVLELYLADMRQLFNSMDPAPFRQRDLDPEAAAYIVDWARELPARQPLGLVLQVGRACATDDEPDLLRRAVHEYFRRQAASTRQRLRQLLREGRYSLLIALMFLAVVIIIGESVATLVNRKSIASLIQDSLIIGGWVALWRPLQIFLYDWWPIHAEAKLFDRLGTMDVSTRHAPLAAGAVAGDGPAP